jgi:hypothetical protein
MEFLLCPGIPLQTGTFNVIIADERLLISALNASPELKRFMFLYVCGNYSRILPAVDTSSTNVDMRRAIAVAVYLILVLVPGWDEMTLLIPLVVITVITGFYYQ